MTIHTRPRLLAGVALSVLAVAATGAQAQSRPEFGAPTPQASPTQPVSVPPPAPASPNAPDNAQKVNEPARGVDANDAGTVAAVEVVGSRIKGAKTTEALPVSVISTAQIADLGIVTGDDLLRTIPENGGVAFNPSNGQQTSNSARGDVGSIDLRGAGIGDTLVLVNGRRVTAYPTSQSKGNVPLIAYNSQALPVVGAERVEILRDGAGAIYGSDAVAGVVNVVTRSNFDGVSANVQGGFAQGTHREEYDESFFLGHNFDHGRGNISLSLDFYQRTAQRPSDEPFTATQDLRPLFANTPGFNASSVPDGRGNQSSYPALVAYRATAAIRQGTTALTTAAGSFHIQPNTLAGCLSQIGNNLCIGSGAVPYTTTANALRYDAVANDATTVAPSIVRENVSLNAHYDLTPDVTVYTQGDYYHSFSRGLTTQPTALVAIGVPASNYYNPFGPVTFANGQANPNRLPNLTNVPVTGQALTFATYRFNDLGPDNVDVDSYQARFLLGAKGKRWGWDWDSAILYGRAEVTDKSQGVNSTALAAQLALPTPDAYNPFNGGCLDGSGGRDCAPSSTAALNAIRSNLKRTSETDLTNLDFKLSRPDLFHLWAGDVGVATGVEYRNEGHSDTRDPQTNGSTSFTDPVLGTTVRSNATGVNYTPSTSGSRDVFSAYAEFAVPVVSPDMHIPLVREVNLQLAGRYENYSDFGSVAKPKVALAWDVVEGVRIRASWQQGFKAPNLETTNPFSYARAQTVTDYYRCQADLNTKKIANFSACANAVGVTYNEVGNPKLDPETSETYDVGLVLQPRWIPEALGRFTFTVDRWSIQQVGIVGVVGPANIAIQDYVSRIGGGAGNPAVIRAAPTADDVAQFAGSGLAAVGAITAINDTFQNLQPQTITGLDFGLTWNKRTERLGLFHAQVNSTYLDKFSQPPTTVVQALFDARAAGVINAATPLTSANNQIQALGNPRWKTTATADWRIDQFLFGAAVLYTGRTHDTAFLSTTGLPFQVKSLTTINLFAEYDLDLWRGGRGLKFRVGARNLFDRLPPIESDGYNGALYQPYGRFIYFNVGATF